jgi:hypothetical protein
LHDHRLLQVSDWKQTNPCLLRVLLQELCADPANEVLIFSGFTQGMLPMLSSCCAACVFAGAVLKVNLAKKIGCSCHQGRMGISMAAATLNIIVCCLPLVLAGAVC